MIHGGLFKEEEEEEEEEGPSVKVEVRLELMCGGWLGRNESRRKVSR